MHSRCLKDWDLQTEIKKEEGQEIMVRRVVECGQRDDFVFGRDHCHRLWAPGGYLY